jgi:hypothetical protein
MAHAKLRTHIVPSLTSVRSVIFVALCFGAITNAQTQDRQKPSGDESWTASGDTTAPNANPSRVIESHSKSGNRTVDKRRVDVLGLNGSYRPSGETETETIQVDASTMRTIVRSYRWDENGQKILAHVTEENSRSTAGGDTHLERKTSAADVNGNLRVVGREIEDTKQLSPGVEETKNTLYQADSYGGFSQTQQTQELKTHRAGDSVEVKTTTRLPDGNGNWKVSKVTEKTVKDDGKNLTTEESVSHSDLEGRLYETKRTISKEGETPTGEKKKTVEVYTISAPAYTDGAMHLNQRVTTVQKRDSNGEVTEQRVEEPSIGNPSDAPKVAGKAKYVVKYAGPATQETRTTERRDANGNFNVSAVETQKSTQPPPPPPNSPAPPNKP